MSSPKDDLEECINKFRNILYKQDDYKITESDTWTLIENLANEMELCKENEDHLQKNLKKCLDIEQEDITTKFVALREKFEQVENENENLKSQIEGLQMKMTVDAELIKNDYLGKLSELEEKSKSEITALKQKIEYEKTLYEAKENKLYEELQLAQANTDLQCDEIESTLTRQIVDANNKLRQSQNIIRNLQMEINNLRNQLASQQAPSYGRPSKPEIRFEPLPVTSSRKIPVYEETESDDTDFFEGPPPKKFTTPLRDKFEPHTDSAQPAQQINTPKVFKGDVRNLTRAGIPSTNKVRRKRKLYDLDKFYESEFPQI